MKRAVLLLSLCLPLLGCVVLQSTYDEQVARSDELEEKLELGELRVSELARRIRDLEKSEETLQLERSSLDEERLGLLEELEDLREGNEQLRQDLEQEKEIRQRQETEMQAISGTYRGLVEALEQELRSGEIEIQRLKGQLHVRALDQHRVLVFEIGVDARVEPEPVLAGEGRVEAPGLDLGHRRLQVHVGEAVEARQAEVGRPVRDALHEVVGRHHDFGEVSVEGHPHDAHLLRQLAGLAPGIDPGVPNGIAAVVVHVRDPG